MNFGLYPKLTKQYILDKINQEDIMDKFLGFPVNSKTLSPNSISSPYREDNNPSCNYYYNTNGKLRFRDHTTGLNYDCFDVVAQEIKVSVNNKQGFMFVLEEIAKAFRLHKFENYDEVLKYEIKKRNHLKKIKKIKNIIQYKVILRDFNYHDASYWKQGELEKKDLKGVFIIKEIYVSYDNQNFKHFYSYNPKDPCYGYYGGKDFFLKINKWKFYFPFRIKGDKRGQRFYTNSSFIQGFQYLKPAKFCILTKSFKDVKVFNKIGLQSCAVSAETIEPTKEEAFKLKSYFDIVITCFDYDRTGMKMAQSLRKKYNFTPLMFTNGFFNSFDYKSKDSFDYVKNNSLESLKKIIDSLYEKNIEEIDNYVNSINNNIKFIK